MLKSDGCCTKQRSILQVANDKLQKVGISSARNTNGLCKARPAKESAFSSMQSACKEWAAYEEVQYARLSLDDSE